jgi:hypothetical protein
MLAKEGLAVWKPTEHFQIGGKRRISRLEADGEFPDWKQTENFQIGGEWGICC